MGNGASSVGKASPGVLMTQAEYARHANVTPSTVTRWLQNGRISRRAGGLIDPEQADRERFASESPMPHHQARKAQIDAEKARQAQDVPPAGQGADSPPQAQPGPTSSEELGLALKLETYKLQKAKAEQANLELDQSAGLLVERSEVEYLLRDLAAVLHSSLDGMAAQLAPALASHRGDVSAMQSEIEGFSRDLLVNLADHLDRQAQQHLPPVIAPAAH